MRKLVILTSLIVLTISSNARYGIGYSFFNRMVAKKLYRTSKRNFRYNENIKVKMATPVDFTKDFKMKLSKKGLIRRSGISEFNYAVTHPKVTTKIRKVLKLKARFKYAYNNYIELKPKKDVFFPSWVKSLDFWIFGIKKKLDVYIYLSTRPNRIQRIKMGRLTHYHWKKFYANIFKQRYKNRRKVKLVRIRIVGHRHNAPKEVTTYLAGFRIYNFRRNKKNLYLNPYYNLVDVTKTEDLGWKLQIGSQQVDRNFYRRIYDRERDRPALQLFIPKQNHNNLDTFIFFGKPYFVYKKFKTSIWIKGKNDREVISLIYRDTIKRLFEVELCKVDFEGWKRVEVIIPDKFFLPRRGYIRPLYITLWGMKISPSHNKNIEIRMDNVRIYRDFRFELLD